MSDEAPEHAAHEEAIRSVEVLNLPYIGPAPVGRWTGIGIGRKTVMDALGLSPEEASAAIGLHLGKTVPFSFATWHVRATIRIDGFDDQPVISFGDKSGAPNFIAAVFDGLFFYGDSVNNLQWAAGSFGGAFNQEWGFLHSGKWLTLREFSVHGTMIDELALNRAFSIPHDEKALILSTTPKNDGTPLQVNFQSPSSKWNWEEMLTELLGFVAASDDGLETIPNLRLGERDSQARLCDWMAAWFHKRYDDSPSHSSLKSRAKAIIIATLLERERSKQKPNG